MRFEWWCSAVLLAAGACASPIAGSPSSTAALEPVLVRGAAGDTVRVIINHVLADKRGQFERFTHELLVPAMVKMAPSDPVTARQLQRARVLIPTHMERDSTYSYIFIVDPVVTSRSYSFPELLTKAYGARQAEEYMQLFRESLARGSDTYLVTNGSW